MTTMIDPSLEQIITRIHATETKLVFEFAGAGSTALAWLHSVGGSSRTIIEATDRYAPTSLADLLGHIPEQFVSQTTAHAMARAAYHRALWLADGTTPVIGVGCTATIATDRAKRGDHGCWVAVCDRSGITSYGLVFAKGARDRAGEEALVSQLIVQAIASASELSDEVALRIQAGEKVERSYRTEPDMLAQLLDGTLRWVVVHPDGRREAEKPVRGALLSGAFNPLHIGHERLGQAAEALLQQPTFFELPIVNADKPPLRINEIERRLAQFQWRYPVVLSRAALFVEKAALFPGCTFVVGYDTAARIIAPRYYGGEAERDAALAQIRAADCRFLVAGRVEADAFRTLADLAVLAVFSDLFVALPSELFRVDVSSSQIRAAGDTMTQ